jgi:glutaminyl-tRNA synthetase
MLDAVNNPEDPQAGNRGVPFSRELYIEQDDFREVPPPKYYRLSPGAEVRLRYAYFIQCTGVVKNPKTGEVTEIHCTYDEKTRGGDSPDGRKVKATLHWVSAGQAVPAEVRLYDALFTREDLNDVPDGVDFKSYLNSKSLEVLNPCYLEPALKHVPAGFRCQFERMGYFCTDPDTREGAPVFNRTVTLKDTWARVEKRTKVS